jgi:hypothetical protein
MNATRLKHVWRFVREHVRRHWPAALFLPALLVVLEHSILQGVPRSFDTSAFVWLLVIKTAFDNVSTTPLPDPRKAAPSGSAAALVVLIDDTTYERRYLERNPLSRCTLVEHLKVVYEAHPDVVAIDLDISPARWLEPEDDEGVASRSVSDSEWVREAQCQRDLYDLLKDASVTKQIATVLMEPWPVKNDKPRQEKICAWQRGMQDALIYFAAAYAEAEYGVVVYHNNNDNSALPAVVHALAESPNGLTKQALFGRCAPPQPQSPDSPDRKLISPVAYRSGLITVPIWPDATAAQAQSEVPGTDPSCSEEMKSQAYPARLNCALKQLAQITHGRTRVVFLGAGYGFDDSFVTPVGDFYGVEVQAASYLSLLAPFPPANELIAFVLDVLIAIGLGLVFGWCWSNYFKRRLMRPPYRERHNSTRYVIYLVGLFMLTV